MEPKQRITITVELDGKHDICLVRKLLKALLRVYGLRCVGLGSANQKDDNDGEQT